MPLKLTKEFIDLYREDEITYQLTAHKMDPQSPEFRELVREAISERLSDDGITTEVDGYFHAICVRYAASVDGNDVVVSVSSIDGSHFSDEFLRHANYFFHGRTVCLPLLYKDTLNSSNPIISDEFGELLTDGQRLRYKLN